MQPLENCIGPTIRIIREILCLPYAGFFKWKRKYVTIIGFDSANSEKIAKEDT